MAFDLDAQEERQLQLYGIDTIRAVASRLANGITGRGKTDWATQALIHALAYGCPYCGGRIMLDNGTIDHKEPIGSAIRRASASSELRQHFDRPDNLHIICVPCNQLKGDFSHEEYLQLRAFLADQPKIEAKLRRRLSQTGSFFKYRRQDQQRRGRVQPRRTRGGGKFTGF